MLNWPQLLVTQLLLAMTMALADSSVRETQGGGKSDASRQTDPCDPTWLPAPNLNRALLGIDIARRHPMPLKPEGDPSYRGTIFNAVYRNADCCMEPYSFIHLTDSLVCTADFEKHSWESMLEFTIGNDRNSMSDWNIGFSGNVTGAVGAAIGSITQPSFSASYGQSQSENSSALGNFFHQEKGSISHSQAKCSLYEVFIDIDEPSLSLHPSFIAAVKDIDLAESEAEKDTAMTNFITKFGTHYAKEAVMGIGVDFESRWNQEETRIFSKSDRDNCNSEKGGVNIFGFSAGGSDTKCHGSLGNITMDGKSAVDRWRVTTYGTLLPGTANLTDWGKMASDMWRDKTLAPVPIRQNLQLITDIFLTPAVAAITHSDGSTVNVTSLMNKALGGFRKYCTAFQCTMCIL